MIAAAAVLLLATPPPATPKCPAPLASGGAVRRWRNYYYLHPCPEAASSALTVLDREGALESGPLGLAAFFGQIAAVNPPLAKAWVEQVRGNGQPAMFFVAQAIWFSRIADRDALLDSLARGAADSVRKYVGELKQDVAPEMGELVVDHPDTITVAWAAFFASGDVRYVHKVVVALDPRLPRPLSDAARESLAARAVEHPRVFAACEHEVKGATPAVRKRLEQILQEVRANPARRKDESKL